MTTINTDASYKKVLFSSAALKLKLRAFASIEKLTEHFLSQLLRDPNLHPKLRLPVTDKLRELQHRKAIDKLLESESSRLGDQE